ncbi:MAG TPA: response regulator [Magnetovibrio sp.]
MKNELHFEQADLIVIDPSSTVRQTLSDVLRTQGFRKITLGKTLADLQTQMALCAPDLVITDDHLPDGDLCELIQNLRHHTVGQNPFVSIIATTWEPAPETVRRIVQTGVDDLLIKPLSPNTLLKRIVDQIQHRKPFVVTSAYIGPDRRDKEARESAIDLLEVPNTLRAKTASIRNLNPATLQAEIDDYLKIVNIQKLDRHADQVKLLVEQILAKLAGDEDPESAQPLLENLLYIAQDIARRMVDTPYAHVSELCDSLIDVTGNILAHPGAGSIKDLQLLSPLSQAIRAGFDESSAEIARTVHNITASISAHH